jgi:hypothetical protein
MVLCSSREIVSLKFKENLPGLQSIIPDWMSLVTPQNSNGQSTVTKCHVIHMKKPHTSLSAYNSAILTSHLDFFWNLFVILALWMQMLKNLNILKDFAKSKIIFSCKNLSIFAWFPFNFKHRSPLLFNIFPSPCLDKINKNRRYEYN